MHRKGSLSVLLKSMQLQPIRSEFSIAPKRRFAERRTVSTATDWNDPCRVGTFTPLKNGTYARRTDLFRLVWLGLYFIFYAHTPLMLLVAPAMVVSGCSAWIMKLTPQKLIPLVVVIVFLLVAMVGQNRAQNMLINEHKWSVDMNSIDGTQVVFASGVRSFSDVTVIVRIDGNVSVVKNADITKIELHESDADHDDKPYTYLQGILDIFKHFRDKLNW